MPSTRIAQRACLELVEPHATKLSHVIATEVSHVYIAQRACLELVEPQPQLLADVHAPPEHRHRGRGQERAQARRGARRGDDVSKELRRRRQPTEAVDVRGEEVQEAVEREVRLRLDLPRHVPPPHAVQRHLYSTTYASHHVTEVSRVVLRVDIRV